MRRRCKGTAEFSAARATAFSAALCATAALVCSTAGAQGQQPQLQPPGEGQPLDTIRVIGTMPIPGIDASSTEVPYNPQTISGDTLDRGRSQALPDQLDNAMVGVTLNTPQGNEHQATVLFRGFAASPLLGMPQGLSIFLDGMRLNEPFGDTVNWDLIPRNALASIQLSPGSNPVYGLNTLGGSLILTTKSGRTHPGTAVEVGAGSHGRYSLGVEYGASVAANANRLGSDAFIAAQLDHDGGWRDYSESRLGSVFARTGIQSGTWRQDLSLMTASNRLAGNGLTPVEFLDQDRSSIYSYDDITRNEGTALNWNGRFDLDNRSALRLNAHLRTLRTSLRNADVNEVEDPRFGVESFEDAPDPDGQGSAVQNRARLEQDKLGLTAVWNREWSDEHASSVGAMLDTSRSRYRRTYELGSFTESRGFGSAGNDQTEIVNIKGRTSNWSLFVEQSWRPAPQWRVTGSLRYNVAKVKTDDRLDPPMINDDGEELFLNNDFRYRKLNPALGVVWNPVPTVGIYGEVSQGNRTPSPIELACADPQNPCLLPNSMQADPYLKQVITRTVELGARGRLNETVNWQAAVFRAVNHDDILFVSAGAGSLAYFTNVPRTRRQGFELGADGKAGRFDWSAGYGFVDATFQSDALLISEGNSTRGTAPQATDDAEILVRRGDRLTDIPRHHVKLGLNFRPAQDWRVGMNMLAFSSSFVRGNENNLHQPGTVTDNFAETREFTGSGRNSAYAIFHAHAGWQLSKTFELGARINNLFDRDYNTGGLLGENAFPDGSFQTDPEAWRRTTFYAPGTPRTVWLSLRARF
ncbi:MAG: TonB-dependent receptor [Lautropia sp.]|nr:TonB-dependent receptor [Lautropia sp.]